MKLQIIFVYVALVLAVLTGQSYAGSKRWRKFEKKVKHAFHEAKEALPVVQQYAGVIGAVGALGRR